MQRGARRRALWLAAFAAAVAALCLFVLRKGGGASPSEDALLNAAGPRSAPKARDAAYPPKNPGETARGGRRAPRWPASPDVDTSNSTESAPREILEKRLERARATLD